MKSEFKDYLLAITNSSDCIEAEVIQSLWSGYGKISRYRLIDSSYKTAVVKFISLGESGEHPRGWDSDNSHIRKVRSYEVETHWYEHYNKRCNAQCRTPKFLGSYSEGKNQWIILEDLDLGFPIRKQHLEIPEVKVCLKWLANFHAAFIGQKLNGLWEVGTYWHLETRPDELNNLEHQELKLKAHLIDEALNNCTFQTIVHGDAKVANFCFSANGQEVAAVDFQYVGGGCGIKDVAYFLGSCLTSQECEKYETELLDYYFLELKKGLDSERSEAFMIEIDFSELHREWTDMYPMACADFMRFMLGWMPSHQKINDYNLKLMNAVLTGF